MTRSRPSTCSFVSCLMLLMLLTACYGPQRRQMLALLDEADSLNRAYAKLPSDTLLAAAADFFDRHGTPNEQLRAHYLLGCAYRDMGEAPRAIDCYLDAAACADTTAADCDFSRLGCVYSQMANTYYYQMLLTNSIDARRQAQHYAELAGDTLWAITDMKMSASVYILQNKKDSAEAILRKAIALYNAHGYIQQGLQSTTMLMHLLVDQPLRSSELKALIDRYDNECEWFDSNHELPPKKRIFYYYKGKYFEATNQLDSAEHYYRKIYRPNMSYMEYAPLYSGLLSVYQKRHQGASIAKYAQLYCMVNDSSVALKDQALTAQMSASYQYSRFQKEARANEAKAYHFRLTLIVASLTLLFVMLIGTYWLRRYVTRQKEKRRLLDMQHREEEERMRQEHEQERNRLLKIHMQKEDQLKKLHLQESDRLKAKYQAKQKALKLEYEKETEQLESQLATVLEEQAMEDNERVMADYANTIIILQIRNKVNKHMGELSKRDILTLIKTTSQHFPRFARDLRAVDGMSQQKMCIAILTALHIKSGDIVLLLKISSSIVSNSKSELNLALFGEEGASKLHANLMQRYPAFVLFPSMDSEGER